MTPQAWEIPEYEAFEFKPKEKGYCLIIFVINEGQKLLKQLERLRPHSDEVDIIIADGGSTDGSTERDVLREKNVRTLLVKTGPGKVSAQMRMAFSYALDQGYEGIVAMDGNNKDDPAAVPSMVRGLREGYDHIQGSRFVKGGRAIRTPLVRLLGIKLVHAPLISIAAGFRYTDTTNGFRAYSRRLLLDDRVAPFRNIFTTYELHWYLAIRAARLGFAVTELPVVREYPDSGPTPTKIKFPGGHYNMIRKLLQVCFHRFDPQTHD